MNLRREETGRSRVRLFRLRIGDLLLIAVLLAAAGVGWRMRPLSGEEAAVAAVCIEGQEVRRIELQSAEEGLHTFTDRGVTYTVEISGSRLRMAEIDCPDHICIKTGWADPQTPIVCMPNRLVIEVEGEAS